MGEPCQPLDMFSTEGKQIIHDVAAYLELMFMSIVYV